MQPGQSFSNTFAAGGTYSYFCSIHPPDGRTNRRQVNVQPYPHMKSSLRSSSSACLKSIFLIVQLAFCFGGPILVKAGQRDSSTGPIQPELKDQAELRQGYLLVYSATDRFDDGGTFYYPHSSYSIYRADGKFFKNVENHISRSDEIPALVTLPAGSYTILLRSENRGYIRLPIVITAGRRTILDPDEAQTDLQKRFAQPRDPRRVAKTGTPRVQVSFADYSISRKLG
jgi:hypothetical protein